MDKKTEELEIKILKGVESLFNDFKNHFQLKDPPTFWTRQDVASFLSVDISTVHNYTKKGILKSYACHGRVYYKRSEVEASLKPLNH